MTAGTCLPGSYSLLYSTTPGGTQRATLTVNVERLTLTSFAYTFLASSSNSNSSGLAEAATLVTALLSADNATAALMRLAQEHLPSFGVDPTSIRAVRIGGASVQPLLPTVINAAVTYAINVQYTATLGSTSHVLLPGSATDPSSPAGRRLLDNELGASSLIYEWGADSPSAGISSGVAGSIRLTTGEQERQQEGGVGRRRALVSRAIEVFTGLRRQAHPGADGRPWAAAGPGEATPGARGDTAFGQPSGSLQHSRSTDCNAVPDAAAATASDADRQTGPDEAIAMQAMQGMPALLLASTARPFLTLAETLVELLGGHCEGQSLEEDSGFGAAGGDAQEGAAAICREREDGANDVFESSRRSLLSTTDDCGAPGFTAPPSGGAIVSASDPTFSCNAWAVSAADVLMAEISGAIIGLEGATAAILVSFCSDFG